MKILIVGDSQGEGPVGRYVEQHLTAAGHLVQRIAHSGHGAYDWTRMHWPEYQSALRTLHPDQVIMIFGSNDPPDSRLEAAMRQFKASAPRVFYAGPPRYDALPVNQERSRLLRDMGKRVFGSDYLDAWPYSGPSVPRTPDHLHFTASGGRVWGAGLMQEWVSATSGLAKVANNLWWIAPAVAGGAGLFALGAFLWSRRR